VVVAGWVEAAPLALVVPYLAAANLLAHQMVVVEFQVGDVLAQHVGVVGCHRVVVADWLEGEEG